MSEPTSGDAKVAALRSEIEQTRAELGETVEELAARADVKARAKEKVDETKARAVATAAEAKEAVRTSVRERPTPWAVVAAAALLAIAALVIGKRRRAAARRVTPESLRAEWRKQWEAAQ
jgi:hypothetical protein